MKVYCVFTRQEYELPELREIYATKEAAEKAVEVIREEDKLYGVYVSIYVEEMEVKN